MKRHGNRTPGRRRIARALAAGCCLAAAPYAGRADGPGAKAGGDAPVYDAPRIEGVVVDGRADDWGDGGFRVDLLGTLAEDLRPPDDLSGRFRLGWDGDGLLALVTVRDDRHVEAEEEARLGEGDAVEFYAADRRGGRDMVQLIVAPGMEEGRPSLRYRVFDHRKSAALKAVPAAVEAVRTRDGDAFTLEMRLPWACLGVAPEAGREIGVQLFLADRDGEGPLYHAPWYPALGTFKNTLAMHRVRLAAAPSAPVRTAASLRLGVRSVRFRLLGPPDLDGAGFEIAGGGAALANGVLETRAGWAQGEATVPYPLPPGAYGDLHARVAAQAPVPMAGQVLPPPTPPPDPSALGARIRRTMTLLATSTPARRNRVKILLYGQSIVGSAWWRQLEEDLRERFPDADLTFENRALGGYGAPVLIRTAAADVYPAYPDLVLFHVYGGHRTGELERFLANVRRQTTAEIVVFTHRSHLGSVQTGDSAAYWRYLAQAYGAELVDAREAWADYLATRGLGEKDLLADTVHPNDLGNHLLAQLVARHFRLNTTAPGGWFDLVRTYEAKREPDEGLSDEIVFTGGAWDLVEPDRYGARPYPGVIGRSPDTRLKLVFEGNRVDVCPGSFDRAAGTARVLIDGRPPSADPGVYAFTRTSIVPGSWWPAIRRVAHRQPLVEEDWTARILTISADHRSFTFRVEGSQTGPDGEGSSDALFVSRSGRVVIEPRDWAIAHAHAVLGSAVPPGHEITWRVAGTFRDTYAPAPPPGQDPAEAARRKPRGPWPAWAPVTVAQGLANGRHTLEIVPNGDGPVPVNQVVVYRPPLR